MSKKAWRTNLGDMYSYSSNNPDSICLVGTVGTPGRDYICGARPVTPLCRRVSFRACHLQMPPAVHSLLLIVSILGLALRFQVGVFLWYYICFSYRYWLCGRTVCIGGPHSPTAHRHTQFPQTKATISGHQWVILFGSPSCPYQIVWSAFLIGHTHL